MSAFFWPRKAEGDGGGGGGTGYAITETAILSVNPGTKNLSLDGSITFDNFKDVGADGSTTASSFAYNSGTGHLSVPASKNIRVTYQASYQVNDANAFLVIAIDNARSQWITPLTDFSQTDYASGNGGTAFVSSEFVIHTTSSPSDLTFQIYAYNADDFSGDNLELPIDNLVIAFAVLA